MAQNSFALMTNLGRAKEAAAIANGTAVVITQIAIGDGTTVPSGGETSLYHEIARKAISGHGTVVGASNVAFFDIFLEAAEGPYTIREAGLIDEDGDLIAIARYDPPINKPIPSSGQTVEGTVRLEVAFSNISAITIVVDPSFKVSLQRINRLPWLPVLSMALAAPPASPSVGDVYLIPTGATGAWVGQAGKIAEFTSAGWGIISPPDGHGVSLPDGRIFERISGSYVEKPALDVQSGKWTYSTAGGTANALTVTLVPAPISYSAGMAIAVKVSLNNTGAATLNVNGLGIKPVVRVDGSDLQKDDLVAGQVASLTYDGAAWQVDGLKSSQLPARNMTVYNAAGSYSFVVPSGVYKIYAICVGGGGGASGLGTTSSGVAVPGGSGAGAGTAEGWVDVAPGQSIPITVGAGGAGGTGSPSATANQTGGNGGAGGTSSVGSFMSATGGGGGAGTSGGGGAGGTGVGGQINKIGGMGQDGGMYRSSAIGGNGGVSSMGGGGRAAVQYVAAACDGKSPGSGGGSVYDAWTSQAFAKGGNGAPGIVILQY